jgi:hypothetical protein
VPPEFLASQTASAFTTTNSAGLIGIATGLIGIATGLIGIAAGLKCIATGLKGIATGLIGIAAALIVVVSAVIVAAVVASAVVVTAVVVASAVAVSVVVVVSMVVVASVVVASVVVIVSVVVVALVVGPSPCESLKLLHLPREPLAEPPRESLRLILLPREPLAELPSHSFHVSFGLVGQVHLHADIGKKIDVANDWRIILLHANVGMTVANRHERIADLRRCIISPPPSEQRGATVELRKVPPNGLQSALSVILMEYHIDGHGGRARRPLIRDASSSPLLCNGKEQLK